MGWIFHAYPGSIELLMKILWLASWYPSKVNPFDGDFVQRQAQALALYQPLTVIHTVKDTMHLFETNPHTEIRVNGNFSEIIVYYRSHSGPLGLLNKMNSTLLYRKYFRQAIERWIRDKGRPDIVHLHIPYKAGLVALWLKRNLGIPYILTEHWAGYTRENPDSYFARNAAFRSLIEKIYQSAQATIVLSKDMELTLKGLFPIQKTFIVPNVVNTDLFSFDSSTQKKQIRFIHVSSMVYQKNVEGILNVLGKLKDLHKDWEMVFVGPAPSHLHQLAANLDLAEYIQWMGEIPYRQVGIEMSMSHALVMFSRFENQPCVILEALCSGLPVVSTRVGGIPEIINSTNGLLIENEDEQGLLDSLLFLIRNRERFEGKSISNAAKEIYNYGVVGKQITDCYADAQV